MISPRLELNKRHDLEYFSMRSMDLAIKCSNIGYLYRKNPLLTPFRACQCQRCELTTFRRFTRPHMDHPNPYMRRNLEYPDSLTRPFNYMYKKRDSLKTKYDVAEKTIVDQKTCSLCKSHRSTEVSSTIKHDSTISVFPYDRKEFWENEKLRNEMKPLDNSQGYRKDITRYEKGQPFNLHFPYEYKDSRCIKEKFRRTTFRDTSSNLFERPLKKRKSEDDFENLNIWTREAHLKRFVGLPKIKVDPDLSEIVKTEKVYTTPPEETVKIENVCKKQQQTKVMKQKRRFQCMYCEKGFGKSSHLRDHHRTHSGERPYGCRYCGKAFSQFSNLRTHLRIHTGEKPFKCHICEKSFTQRVTLRSHLRTHNKGIINTQSHEILKNH